MSSLNSVVNKLVRAAASVPTEISDADLDAHVARILAEEAKANDNKWSELGLGAYLNRERERDSPDPNAPKPNKRFLSSIIRQVDGHNAALLRQQAQAARQARSSLGTPESSRGGSGRREDGKKGANRLFGGALKGLGESRTREKKDSRSDRDRGRDHDRARDDRRNARERSTSRDRDRDSTRERDHRRDDDREYRRGRDRSSSRSPRRRHHSDDESDYRSRRRHDSDDEDRRERRRVRERSRERSRRDDDYKSKRERSRSRSRERERDDRKEREGKSSRRDRDRSRSPSRRQSPPESSSKPTRRRARDIDEKPRAPSVSPPPPPSRISRMDRYFKRDYDPRLDVGEVPKTGPVTAVGWDNMLAVLKDRGKKRRRNSPTLSSSPEPERKPRTSGFPPKPVVKDTMSAEMKDLMDMEYTRRGQMRAWDVGKDAESA